MVGVSQKGQEGHCEVITACCCHVFVPQYGRLAAISALLALNHCACLRNARRISYTSKDCGLSLHRNEQKQTATKTKSRRPTSLHLTCIIVVGGEKQGGEKQGNASVRFLGICTVFVTVLFKSICIIID